MYWAGEGQPPANIYLSCCSVVRHTQGSAAVPHWVHKNTDFFFHSKVFDVSVFIGRFDAFADGVWVTGSTTPLQRLGCDLQVSYKAVQIIIVKLNSLITKLICQKMASLRISKSAIRWQGLKKHQHLALKSNDLNWVRRWASYNGKRCRVYSKLSS